MFFSRTSSLERTSCDCPLARLAKLADRFGCKLWFGATAHSTGIITFKRVLRARAAVSLFVWVCSSFFQMAAFAKPVRLDCMLTGAGGQGKETTTRQIGIVFDTEVNKLDFYDGAQRRELAQVTISTISIDGYTDDLSIGIDRSSWSIVVQTYASGHVHAEFGVCKPQSYPQQ